MGRERERDAKGGKWSTASEFPVLLNALRSTGNSVAVDHSVNHDWIGGSTRSSNSVNS